MFSVSGILIAAVLAFIVWQLIENFSKKWKNCPPGPRALPIIGNLHQLSKGLLNVIGDWKEIYGNIVALQFGQYRVVVLSGYDTIKEAYEMWDFAGRQLLKPFHVATGGEKLGLSFSEGKTWSEQRRFALRNLRDFGFGKKSMESLIQEDITELMEHFKEQQGRPFVPHRKFGTAVFKSLWNIIAGERFAYGDPKFQDIMDRISNGLNSTALTGPALFIPWLIDLFPGRTGLTAFTGAITSVKTLIGKYIKEHQETFQKDSPRDYMDVYLREISETTDENSSFYKEKGEKNLLLGTMNLFAAGSDTTSTTLVWALLYLIKYPRVQEKLYNEIRSVCGTSRMPSLEDRELCVYTWAVMEEVLRCSSLAPLGVAHSTMNDVNFKGYFIPKDTLVFANLYGVLMDKNIWKDPKEFRPERFLIDNEGGKLVKNTNVGPVIAFGLGKRACPGEVLARNNFFLYLTSLVQKFEFTATKELDPEATSSGLFRVTKEFEVVLKER